MFERYTEKARRVIFFARYEASQYGSPEIDTEHLLLGLAREEPLLHRRWLPRADPEIIRKRFDRATRRRQPIPTSIDLPLSQTSKEALFHAKDEADRLNSKHIGTEHLLLGLIHEKESGAGKLLHELGGNVTELRKKLRVRSNDHEVQSPLMYTSCVATPQSLKQWRSTELHGMQTILTLR
jgi:ATP-dependent Clp protease ATP-binding subunit ClpC